MHKVTIGHDPFRDGGNGFYVNLDSPDPMDIVAGESALGTAVYPKNHPQLDPTRSYVITGYLPDRDGFYVEASPQKATRFEQQRTQRVLLEQVDSYNLVSVGHAASTVAHSPHLGRALRAEGFDPMDLRIVRSWRVPNNMRITDPFQDLPSIALALGPGWTCVTGYFVAEHEYVRNGNPSKRFELERQGPSVVAGLEACLLCSPTGELYDFNSTRDFNWNNVGPEDTPAKTFIAEKDQSVMKHSWEAMATYFFFQLMGPEYPPGYRSSFNLIVLPFRTDVDSIYDHTNREHRQTWAGAVNAQHESTDGTIVDMTYKVTRRALHKWYGAYLREEEAGRAPKVLGHGMYALDSKPGTNPVPDGPLLPLYKCAFCGVLDNKKKCCSLCSTKHYCSRLCQACDWHEGGHKRNCSRCNKSASASPPTAAPAPEKPALPTVSIPAPEKPAPQRMRTPSEAAPKTNTMDVLRERARIREEFEAAERWAIELERRRKIAAHRLERANQPEAGYTAKGAQRRPTTSGTRSRGKSRGTANELTHQVWTSEDARESRRRYGELKQAVEHLEAETRKAKDKAQRLRQLEINMGKEEAAATHHVPPASSVGSVVDAASSRMSVA